MNGDLITDGFALRFYGFGGVVITRGALQAMVRRFWCPPLDVLPFAANFDPTGAA